MEIRGITAEGLEMRTLPHIPGLAFRQFRGESDFALMVDIINASHIEDGIQEAVILEEVAKDCTPRDKFNPYTDMVLVEVDGDLVGHSEVTWSRDLEENWLGWHTAYLLPEWRRKGIGRSMLVWNESRLTEIAAAQEGKVNGGSYFQVFSQATAVGRNALIEQAGYAPVRFFYSMQRVDLQDLPEAPLPEDVCLRSVEPEHMRAIWDTKNKAFRDHWGYGQRSEEDYAHWLEDPYNDPSMWQVAWERDEDGGEESVAGMALNFIYPEDNARFGFLRGEVRTLGVLHSWRKRGLGRALLIRSMHALRERGMTEVILEVDTDNLTGAQRLYEGVGFRTLSQDAIYRKPLP
jgi:mycothiol synthase